MKIGPQSNSQLRAPVLDDRDQRSSIEFIGFWVDPGMCYFFFARLRQSRCAFPQRARPASFASVSTGRLPPLQATGAVNNSWLPRAAGERFHRHASVRHRPHKTPGVGRDSNRRGQLIKNRSTSIQLPFFVMAGHSRRGADPQCTFEVCKSQNFLFVAPPVKKLDEADIGGALSLFPLSNVHSHQLLVYFY